MTKRDIMRVSEPPVAYSHGMYVYAGRWYPYDPTLPGARERYCDQSGPRRAMLALGSLGFVVSICIGVFVNTLPEAAVIGGLQMLVSVWVSRSIYDLTGNLSSPYQD